MIRSLAVGSLLLVTGAVVAADKPAATVQQDMEVRIALSPQAAKRADSSDRLDLYRKYADGDEKARKAWRELQPAQRTKIMADTAIAKEPSALKNRAIKELGLMSPSEDPDGEGVAALARVAVADGDGTTRALARTAIVAHDDTRVLAPLGTALRHKDALFRGNAAEALRAMGGPRVFEVIIEHWKEVWGEGPRCHCFFGQMRSYIADYDISGDSYDPVVRSFMTGVVLDTKVLRVEGDIYYITIREVAPADVKLPNDPVAWKNWLEKERDKLAEDGKKKKSHAISMLAGAMDE